MMIKRELQKERKRSLSTIVAEKLALQRDKVAEVIKLHSDYIKSMALSGTEFNISVGPLGHLRRKPSKSTDRLKISEYDRLFIRKQDYERYKKLSNEHNTEKGN